MAQTIDFDDDFISEEELKLLQTKQAILAKLRVRFEEFPPAAGTWPGLPDQEATRRADSRGVQRPG